MAKMKSTAGAPVQSEAEANKENFRQEVLNKKALKEESKAEKNALKEQIRAMKEAARQEKELKRLQEEEKKKQREEQEEAQKEEKRKEREMRKQQAEAEKDQKKKARAAAEQKQHLARRKQASVMERFLSRKESETAAQNQPLDLAGSSTPSRNLSNQSSPNGPSTPFCKEVISHMDLELIDAHDRNPEELFRLHTAAWKEHRKSRSSKNFQRWGVRRKPKVTVYRELRLQGAGPLSTRNSSDVKNPIHGGTPTLKRTRQEFEEDAKLEMDREEVGAVNDNVLISPRGEKRCNRVWKLLQFDKSHRPAFYGTSSLSSATVGPRCPLRKDTSLDYKVDSDEEWEEEDPGENLSDCEDKEDAMEKVEQEGDEDTADGFVVPDGYLSESEGVHFEDAGCDDTQASELGGSCNAEGVSEGIQLPVKENESETFQRLTKLLDDATKQALQRNRPLLVTAFLHQTSVHIAPQPSLNHTERLCLQALSMRVVAPALVVEQPAAVANMIEEIEMKQTKVKSKQAKRRPLSTLDASPDCTAAFATIKRRANKAKRPSTDELEPVREVVNVGAS